MSNNAKKKLNEKATNQLTYELDVLKENADNWYSNEYKTTTDMLYDMFASLYSLYEKCDGNDDVVQTNVRKYITNVCAKKNIKFKAKKPSLQALLVKFMFDDGKVKDCKRVSSYVRVFTLATTLADVNSKNIANWIEHNGGIENLRQQQSEGGVSKEARIEEGKATLKSKDSIANIITDITKHNTQKVDEVVLLVGIQNADGSVSVKHTIYEKIKNSKISGKTVINTALCNVYSVNNEQKQKQKLNKEAESEAKSKANISDIVNAKDENDISFQNEKMVAA
jgi:hypothetical protein